MDSDAEIQQLLKEIGPGRMSSTAYDTAWVARLGEIDWELSSHALEWLCENQLPDGSWGAKDIFYYHDRIISTLSALIALSQRGRRAVDKNQIEKGLLALEKITAGATQGLAADPNGATVGFEMIIPTLVAEAEKLGVIKQQGDRILGRLAKMRSMKMAKLKGLKINRYLTTILSAEMAGSESIHFFDIANMQETNGSIGYSPASTAYYAGIIKPGDERALNYLRKITTNGGAPFVAPFDIFEPAWALWNISLLDNISPESQKIIESHLNFLEEQWIPKQGVSFTKNCALIDSDDTSVTHRVLTRFGRKPDIEALLSYEENTHFRCYEYEINPSIGANLHILGALKLTGVDKNHPAIQKILQLLRVTRYNNAYWFDKWHISPYYITSHVIIECQGYDDSLCQDSIEWILNTQKSDGSWGFYNFSTAEETALCVTALKMWTKNGGHIPENKIEMGLTWLNLHQGPPYPWMWIGKSLYYPELLIRSTILTALSLEG